MNINEHLAINVMGWKKVKSKVTARYIGEPYLYVDDHGNTMYTYTADWNPTENIEQAFMCGRQMESYFVRYVSRWSNQFQAQIMQKGLSYYEDSVFGKTDASTLSQAIAKATGWEEA